MLSASAVGITFDDDDWNSTPLSAPRLYRTASVGSWGVTSIGRGFDWNERPERSKASGTLSTPSEELEENNADPVPEPQTSHGRKHHNSFQDKSPVINLVMTSSPQSIPQPLSCRPTTPNIPPLARSPSSPRPRRRSSQQRVSLIAGRVSIAPIEPPSPPPMLSDNLRRTPSSGSILSNVSTRAPSPSAEQSFLGGRNISEFVIEGEIGRGAYGLVKRAREVQADGSLGPPLVIKQVIKSRILADCWKKHPKHGTIPIEIYVMSAISNTTYVLPPRRPWDPARFSKSTVRDNTQSEQLDWQDGQVVKGHPNICPLLDFFEDSHYYYLVLPSTTPERKPNDPSPPSDLFDLVESYPQGLPPSLIRTYLGQIADAVCFLHMHGIVHRDIKDENVVLGPNGKCILIDFGSSGLVKKSGWDTFSGTLDYAGPEILRGERYYGKEQDVWAFGVVAYVLLVGECPFMTAAEAQEGLASPFANAAISLDERCAEGKEKDGEEQDGGGALGDAAALVRACLQVDISARPTFERILQCRFLAGDGGWT
ncbi:Serine/threonine-protein kinase ppk6 [Psilocybe cubensis]|uniref:Protein kinase domain-containing protein n=2 Tax=Psilocybe cubensis TaxID=181762 RepID=A0A8H7YBE6_PSICU|nr:Serine/threonine-protein kinase ppk6 [Psilocybe cubensis]KAH9486891.1 Serine/threonine-protein kinase ppk6 [Psilocybe cubensis]